MRQLADACDLNVATIYHYFPSKADLLRAVMEERGYPRRLGEDGPPPEVSAAPTASEAVRRLLTWLWQGTLAEESAWRLLIGEGLRGEPARTRGGRPAARPPRAGARRMAAHSGARAGRPGAPVAGVMRSALLSLAVEHLALGPDEARATARIDELVQALQLD